MAMRTSSHDQSDEELPYVVELWQESDTSHVERVLARASNLKLAHAILRSVEQDYPQRRVTLRNGAEIVAETASQVPLRT